MSAWLASSLSGPIMVTIHPCSSDTCGVDRLVLQESSFSLSLVSVMPLPRPLPLPAAVGQMVRANPRSVPWSPLQVQAFWAGTDSLPEHLLSTIPWLSSNIYQRHLQFDTASILVNRKLSVGLIVGFLRKYLLAVNHPTKHFTCILSTTLCKWGKEGSGSWTFA